jgi:hypothetical protein
MERDKRIQREEIRRPGMRRVLDAMKAIERERPGLVEKAAVAARALAKNRGGDGGRGLG